MPTISNGFNVGDPTYIPIITKDNSYQELLNLTYTRGHHTFKAGGTIIQRQVQAIQSSQGRGGYTFDTNLTNNPQATSGTGFSFASFLLGNIASVTRNILLVRPNYSSHEPSMYIQDDWKLSQKLTLNLRARWEYATAITEKHGNISNFNPATGLIIQPGINHVNSAAEVNTYRANFSPRIGFAYSLDSKTVIRGGFGFSYFPPSMGSPLALRNPPNVSLLTITSSPITPTAGLLSDGLPAPVATSSNPTGTLTTTSLKLKMPYIEQFNLTFQRELGKATLTISGVGALGRRGILALNINPATPHSATTTPINTFRPYYSTVPNVSAINESRNYNNSEYFGLQTILERRLTNGLSFTAANTWGHNIDYGEVQYIYRSAAYERGNSDLDVRDRFTLSVNYQLPFFAHSTGVVGAIGKGWQVNGITLASGGFPFNVTNQTAQSNTGNGDRPNLIGNPNLSSPTVKRWFNTAAFATQTSGTFGTTPRNALRAPRYFTQDLSLFKNFDLCMKGYTHSSVRKHSTLPMIRTSLPRLLRWVALSLGRS